MKKISYKIFLIFLFFTAIILQTNLYSQVTQEWVRSYNNPSSLDDNGFFIVTDKNDNIYVTGVTIVNGESNNIFTIKYSASGVQQWVKIYNGISNSIDWPRGIAIDDSLNVFITGYTTLSSSGQDWVIIKYNSSGVQQWIRFFNGIDNGGDIPGYPVLDKNGFLYVTGSCGLAPRGSDIITVKYNAYTGDTVWTRRFHEESMFGNYQNATGPIVVDNSGNVYVMGSSYWGFGPPFDDIITIKYNSNGVFQWVRKYDGPSHNNDLGKMIALDSAQNIIVCGSSSDQNSGLDYATIKYNPAGVQQWTARYNGTGNSTDIPHGLGCDINNNIYVTGESTGDSINYDYLTVKYNTYGDTVWVRRYNGTGGDEDNAYTLAMDNLKNIYISGRSIGLVGYDMTTIKYNTDGVQQWMMRYPGVSNAICVDKSYNVCVTGSNSEASTGIDCITIKYSQFVGVTPPSKELPNSYDLMQNYPNPFNPSSKIRLTIPKKSYIQLKIYDVLGRIKEILIDKELIASEYEVTFNASEYSSGVYFYQLTADGNIVDTKKLVIIK